MILGSSSTHYNAGRRPISKAAGVSLPPGKQFGIAAMDADHQKIKALVEFALTDLIHKIGQAHPANSDPVAYFEALGAWRDQAVASLPEPRGKAN